jgi:hypothetical protein
MKVTPIRKKFGRYAPGEVFELPDRSARLLIKVGKLQAADAATPAAPVAVAPVEDVRALEAPVADAVEDEPDDADGGSVQAAAMTPGAPAASAEPVVRERRSYQRRDVSTEPKARKAPAKKARTKRVAKRPTEN